MALIPTPKRVLGAVREVIATGLDTARSIVGRETTEEQASVVEAPPIIGSNPKRRHTSKTSRSLAR